MIRSVRVLCCAGFVVLCGALADGSDDVSTGTDTPAVLRRLEAIRDSYRRANSVIKDYRVTGKRLPGGESFSIVVKDGKRRLDEQILAKDGSSNMIYRLDDGQYFFHLNADALGISTLVERDIKWRSTIGFFSKSTMPSLSGDYQTIDEFCQWLIDVIQNEQVGTDARICVRSGDGVLRIELQESSVHEFVLVLSSQEGYNMVELRHTQRAPTSQRRSWRNGLHVKSRYQEIASGVFFLSSSSFTVKESGEVAEDQGTAGTVEGGLEVVRVEIGDFDVPSDFFSVHSLPIETGIAVHDERTSPVVDYVYEQGPFDENVLNRAIASQPLLETGGDVRWIWVCVTLALVVVLVAVFSYRWHKNCTF